MQILVFFLIIFLLFGCEDRYRYKCQNPDHFQAIECQRPKCLFTQQCSDYLVAPVLEKQVVQQQSSNPAPSDK